MMKPKFSVRLNRSACLLALAAAFVTTPAFAADNAPAPAEAAAEAPADEAEQSPDIVVRGRREPASQTAQEAVVYGNNVQIVSSEAIEASGASNFAEVAQFLIKGANIGYSPDEGEYTIRLDGGGDRDTLVVLDNVPLYDRGPALETIWGTTIIDPHIIERVEVFRGGNSLFFGSNGGIGVVSIVSKKPDGGERGELGVSYGSFNSREIWGNYTFPIDSDGKHSLMVYGTAHHTDSPRIFNPASYVDNVAAGGGIQKFPVSRNDVGAKYLFKIGDQTNLRIGAEYTKIEFHDPFPDNNTYSPNQVTYPIVNASLDHRWSPVLFTELSGYWSNPQLRNTETYPDICKIEAGCPDPAGSGKIIPWGKYMGRNIAYPNQGFGPDSKRSGFQEIGANFRNTISLENIAELVAGVQVTSYKNDSDPIFPIGNKSETVTGVYGDLRPVIPFSPDTKLSLAIRTDFAKSFGSRTIWKVGFRQPIGDFYIRGNGGTSYSAPQTNELYMMSPTTVGNPDLKTEETESYNVAAGFSHDFGTVRAAGEIGYFHTDITNRIRTTSGLTPNTFYNDTALTQVRGITADFDLNIGQTLSVNLGFTKQDAHLKGSKLQINETPEYMIQGRLTYTTPDQRFQVNLFPRYQGPEWATGGIGNTLRHNFGNYFVLNGSLAYWLGDERQHKLQLRLVNILGEKYDERYGYGNMRFSEAFITGQLKATDPGYYYGYGFEGKPRSVFLSFTTQF